MTKPFELLLYFGIFSALTLVIGKIFWVFGVLSGIFEYFFSLTCYIGVSKAAILEVSLASSGLLIAFLVMWIFRTFFLGK